jgi:ABC-2 type transport system ATP-binding protein
MESVDTSVKIKNLSVVLDGQIVLKNISLSLPAGGIIGLIGPNGAGKTTLMRTIVGSQRASGGSIEVLGLPAGAAELRSQIGYMTQSASVYNDLTVQENIYYFAVLAGQSKDHANKTLKLVELSKQAPQLAGKLSGGQRSRLSLAVALLGRPKLLVLDEPTVGLDPLLRRKLWQIFKGLVKDGVTILVSSHVMEEAAYCDQLVLIRDGGVIAYDSPKNLLSSTHTSDIEASYLKLIGKTK